MSAISMLESWVMRENPLVPQDVSRLAGTKVVFRWRDEPVEPDDESPRDFQTTVPATAAATRTKTATAVRTDFIGPPREKLASGYQPVIPAASC